MFSPKSAASIRTLRFSVFGPGPEFIQVPKAQNGPEYHWTTVSDRWGSDQKKVVHAKVAENHRG